MIDLSGEPYLLLSQAARLVPGRSRRGGIDPSTLWRWATLGRGPQRRKLRVEAVPGGLVTRQSWLEEYLRDFTAERARRRELKLRTQRQARAEYRRADEVLRRAGIR